jgi:hypothetical protein
MLMTVVLLMIANWSLETLKWHMLMRSVHQLSWFQAVSGVLSGITISMFTPNRSGEFAGRALHADPGFRIQAALASLVGSMNQLLITILAGGCGLIFTLRHQPGITSWVCLASVSLTVLFMCAAIFLYFHLPSLNRLQLKIMRHEKVRMYISVFGHYSRADLLRITMYSTGRYLLFTSQFLLLLDWFGVQLAAADGVRLISVIYLVMTFIPSFAVSELTVRGSVALYFLGPYTSDSTAIIAATTLLWFVNLVIPSLPGAFTFLMLKLQNNTRK